MLTQTLPIQSCVDKISTDRDFQHIAIVDQNGDIALYRRSNGLLLRIPLEASEVKYAAFGHNAFSEWVELAVVTENEIRRFSVKDGVANEISAIALPRVTTAAFSVDSSYLFASDERGTIFRFEASTGEKEVIETSAGELTRLVPNSLSNDIVVATSDTHRYFIARFDTGTLEEQQDNDGNGWHVRELCFHPHLPYFALLLAGELVLINIERQEVLATSIDAGHIAWAKSSPTLYISGNGWLMTLTIPANFDPELLEFEPAEELRFNETVVALGETVDGRPIAAVAVPTLH